MQQSVTYVTWHVHKQSLIKQIVEKVLQSLFTSIGFSFHLEHFSRFAEYQELMLNHFQFNKFYSQTLQPQESLHTLRRTALARAISDSSARFAVAVDDGGAQVVVQLHRGRRSVEETVGGKREGTYLTSLNTAQPFSVRWTAFRGYIRYNDTFLCQDSRLTSESKLYPCPLKIQWALCREICLEYPTSTLISHVFLIK